MAQIEVAGIWRTANHVDNYDIRRGFGNWNLTVANNVIFNPNDAPPAAVNEGNHPVAFKFNANTIPLFVAARYAFPPGQAAYQLRGTGPGNFHIISQNFNATGDANGAEVDFDADGFTYHLPVVDSPFKVAGDWTWTLLQVATNNVIAHSGVTRLEVYFFLGDHNLPYVFAGIHFQELIRLSIPDYVTIAGQQWAMVEDNVIWQCVVGLWNLGGPNLYYDSRIGVGGAAQHLLGTNFNLETIIMQTQNICNCYDLAALVKVSLNSLGNRPDPANPGHEIPVVNDVRLTADAPWGYIPAGPLFGWVNTNAHNCNSPFWVDFFGPGLHAQPNVGQYDQQRTNFGAHCYVVFTNHAGQDRVIDICHATLAGAGPAFLVNGGALDVVNYRAGAIDLGYWIVGAPAAQNVIVNWIDP